MTLLFRLGGCFFLLAYIAFAVAIARSAIQARGKHWMLGAVQALLLFTLPVWVGLMYRALETFL
ncbi:MAG TPA: hypothetical protein VJ783_24290 [Pirellulales bacterium]|nr:hypothetical protein [Pirellulales bacterium]